MTWFKSLVGFEEIDPDQVRKNLKIADDQLHSEINGASFYHGTLELPTLGELRQKTEGQLQGSGNLSLSEIVGDVQKMHQAAASEGAFFQVASQFNILEMVGPGVPPEHGVGIYEHDLTQGPACAIACGAATIYRNYFVNVDGQTGQTADNQIDCASGLGRRLGNDDDRLWTMKNGYLLASEAGLHEIGDFLESADEDERDEYRKLLRIGVQSGAEVTLGGTGNRVSQAFCSAVPVSYSQQSAQLWEPLARLILEAAYESTFHAAFLNFQKTGNPHVFLTPLGGGAFGNQREWIFDAISRSLDIFSDTGLVVKIVSYGRSNFDVAQFVDGFT